MKLTFIGKRGVCEVEERHGIVLASTQEAKRFGVRTGDLVWQARQKCPRLVVEPHMDRYVEFSKAAREIYGDYTPCVGPFGLDKCYLDLTGTTHLFGGGERAGQEIRERIKRELGMTVSIGVSFNRSLAKLASEVKSPTPVPSSPGKTSGSRCGPSRRPTSWGWGGQPPRSFKRIVFSPSGTLPGRTGSLC